MPPFSDYVSYKHISSSHTHFIASISSIKELNNFQEAIKDAKWIKAVNQELQALELNKIWEVVEYFKIRFPLDVNGYIK